MILYLYLQYIMRTMLYRPEIIIDSEMLTLVSEIAELIARIPEEDARPVRLKLRRDNRVRTIHSTAAIEGNKLSLEEVTEIIDGKHVAGDPKDILEIKNAKKAYDRTDRYDPFSIRSLLSAHGTLMKGLIDRPGEFRDCEVGVFKGGSAVHIAPEHDDVPMLMNELFGWCKKTEMHPLILSCAFHCRFEYIHPFVDGNGRMGRLWQSLILSRWRPAFGYLPIESWVNANKKEYYASLNKAHKGDISKFIRYMLTMIKMAVDEFADELMWSSKRPSDIKGMITGMISKDPKVTAAKMAEALGVSSSTVKRHLSAMAAAGMIKRVGSDKTGHWEIP